jgi:broad specificity phosphatase PhoE
MSDSGPRPEGTVEARTPAVAPASSPTPRLRLALVRHGESTWNQSRRIQGQLDPPLSDLGRQQARRLAHRLRKHPWQAVYTSDLARARQTAGLVDTTAVPRSDLREVALGQWEGLTRAEIVESFPDEWNRWAREPDWDVVPGGEGTDAFRGRVVRALESLVEAHPSGDVLVVTHGGVIQAALAWALGSSLRGLFPFLIQNTSITVLDRVSERVVVAAVNDTGHLPGSAIPGV